MPIWLFGGLLTLEVGGLVLRWRRLEARSSAVKLLWVWIAAWVLTIVVTFAAPSILAMQICLFLLVASLSEGARLVASNALARVSNPAISEASKKER